MKDYTKWQQQKSELNDNKMRAHFHEREIWFTKLGVNVGYEQDGRGGQYLRPVLVLKKFNNEVLWCIPLTKTEKKGDYYFSFKLLEKTSTAILSQIRLIDSKRLEYKLGDMTQESYIEIKEKIKQLLA